MRILQVCPYDWHTPGGVQTHVRELSVALRARGHEVIVAAPGKPPVIPPRQTGGQSTGTRAGCG